MKLSWEREDLVSSDDEFAEMASAVASFVQCCTGNRQKEALMKIAALRSKEVSDIAELLDALYTDVKAGSSLDIDNSLTKVLNKKRETQRKTDTSGRNKPKK